MPREKWRNRNSALPVASCRIPAVTSIASLQLDHSSRAAGTLPLRLLAHDVRIAANVGAPPCSLGRCARGGAPDHLCGRIAGAARSKIKASRSAGGACGVVALQRDPLAVVAALKANWRVVSLELSTRSAGARHAGHGAGQPRAWWSAPRTPGMSPGLALDVDGAHPCGRRRDGRRLTCAMPTYEIASVNETVILRSPIHEAVNPLVRRPSRLAPLA